MSWISLLQYPLCDRESTENLGYDETSRDYMYTKCFSVEKRDKFPTQKFCKKGLEMYIIGGTSSVLVKL